MMPPTVSAQFYEEDTYGQFAIGAAREFLARLRLSGEAGQWRSLHRAVRAIRSLRQKSHAPVSGPGNRWRAVSGRERSGPLLSHRRVEGQGGPSRAAPADHARHPARIHEPGGGRFRAHLRRRGGLSLAMAIATSFRQELEAAVMERHCANHPMTEKWARGELSRNAMMGWAVEHWHWVSKMVSSPFSICSKAPPRDVIAMEMANYHEENDDEKPHLEIVLRFARANGADVEKVKAGRGLPTTRSWANWLVQ